MLQQLLMPTLPEWASHTACSESMRAHENPLSKDVMLPLGEPPALSVPASSLILLARCRPAHRLVRPPAHLSFLPAGWLAPAGRLASVIPLC